MFKDRADAGMQLAEKLAGFSAETDLVVLGLPRGGIVTAAEIAARLKAPLDVLIVRKIGYPWHADLAVGAISEMGSIVYNEHVISSLDITKEYLRGEAARQREEISRCQQLYRNGQPIAELGNKTVIVADDGVATGSTMKAALESLRLGRVRKLIAAVPVAPRQAEAELRSLADGFVCLDTPGDFTAVSCYYAEFPQVTDADVKAILDSFRGRQAA